MTSETALPQPPVGRERNANRHLISLGFRCDVAFNLRMHGAENVAHFFDWLAIPLEGVIKIIAADFDVFHPDHLVLKTDVSPHCVQDLVTGTVFHHQFPLYAGHMQPDFLLLYDSFIKKFQHLAARFREYMQTRPVTLVRRVATREQALQLEEVVLRRFPGADVEFLYLYDKGSAFTTPHGRGRILPAVPGSLGDPAEWARLLSEEGLIGEPYRHGTVEILGAAHDDHNLSTDNRFTEAQLLAAIEVNPRSPVFPLELARLYELRGQWSKVEAYAVGVLARAPQNQPAMFKATLAQWRLNKLGLDEVVEILKRLCASATASPGWLRETAAACLAAGLVEDALRYATRAVCADPTDQRNYLQKIRCLYQAQRLGETELALAAAMRLGPVAGVFQHIHAKILAWRGEVEAAAAVEWEILQRDMKNLPSLLHLADLAKMIEAVPAVIGLCRAALPLFPEHQNVLEGKIAELSAFELKSAMQPA